MIDSVKHIAPHVIFERSSISYLSEEYARQFYDNLGEQIGQDEKAALMNYICRAHQYEEVYGDDQN